MTRPAVPSPAIIAMSAGACLGLVLAGVQAPVRVAVAAWFLLVCPGLALSLLLGVRDLVARWTLAIALSLALDGLVALVLVYLRAWSPIWALEIVVTVSLAACAGSLARATLGRQVA